MDLITVDKLLTTTRSVRKRLDLIRPVEPEIIQQCIEIAVQAPTAGNRQHWHFIVVTDPAKKAEIADLYRQAFTSYMGTRQEQAAHADRSTAQAAQASRVVDSSTYLAEHLQDVPVLIIGCIAGRPKSAIPLTQAGLYGSILPAMWSLMLALRARGLGAAWTTLHLRHEKKVAELLGIPDDITQTVLLPVAYFTGDDFKPAPRTNPKTLTYWDTWGVTRP